MHRGNRLVALGLAVVFLAVVVEYFGHRLSGMAVGFALVLTGFLLLIVEPVATGRSGETADLSNRDG